MRNSVFCILLMATASAAAAGEHPAASDLSAEYRHGQVFLTWQEPDMPEGATFSVYVSAQPITEATLGRAKRVCNQIGPHSAWDWWLDHSVYGRAPKADGKTGKKPSYPRRGFVIKEGGEPLDPESGLHVHTVQPGHDGPRYYAVTCVVDGKEDKTIVPGRNATRTPVAQKQEPTRPICQVPGANPRPEGSEAGLPIWLQLHAKGCLRAKGYLAFGDASLGWREGLPFKFDLSVRKDVIVLVPSDSSWIGRRFTEARDGTNRGNLAIYSFWYGYSDSIRDPALVPAGVPTNYTERRLLWLISWARRHFGADPNRTYCSGSSMGACGTIDFALRHSEIFAAIWAHVGNVAYKHGDKARGWTDNWFRIIAFCGPLDLRCSDGMTLEERLDSARFVQSHTGDLPFLAMTNSRNDGSIQWQHLPGFYRAMQARRHGFVAAWNDATHSTNARVTPPDFMKWSTFERLSRFAINKSYPAFSRCSKDGDPGNGDKDNGDIVGYMNYGLDWADPTDLPDRYEVLVRWNREQEALPVAVDVTPRRVQRFRLKPGEACDGVNLDADGRQIQSASLRADKDGLLTFAGLRITSAKGNRLVLTRRGRD